MPNLFFYCFNKFLSVQFSSIKYIRCCATITTKVHFQNFSSPQTEALYPLNSNFPSPPYCSSLVTATLFLSL